MSVWWLVVSLAEARAEGDVDRVRVLERKAEEELPRALRLARGKHPRARRLRLGFVESEVLVRVQPPANAPAQFGRGRY
jgi:hypothetical protein